MGKLDGPEEVEVALKPRRKHLGINELEKEMDERKSLEVVPEVMLEVVPEVMPEVVPEVDIEMTLQ